MADTTFQTVLPALKAVDNGDGTYSLSIYALDPGAGTDTTFNNVFPALKAVDNGDNTYLVSLEVVT